MGISHGDYTVQDVSLYIPIKKMKEKNPLKIQVN